MINTVKIFDNYIVINHVQIISRPTVSGSEIRVDIMFSGQWIPLTDHFYADDFPSDEQCRIEMGKALEEAEKAVDKILTALAQKK